MSNDLPTLLSRLNQAEGPDREIDAAIYWHFLETNREERPLWWVQGQFAISPWRGAWNGDWRQPYSGSIDAITSLIEAKLPGWGCRIRKDRKHGGIEAFIDDPDDADFATGKGVFAGEAGKGQYALALCIAFVKAILGSGLRPRPT